MLVASASRTAEIRKHLDALRAEVLSEIAELASSSAADAAFDIQKLQRLRASLDGAIVRLNGRLQATGTAHMGNMVSLGGQAIPGAFATAGVAVDFLGVDLAQAELAQQYNATLIRGLTTRARTDINGLLMRSVLGERPHSIMKKISDVLRTLPRGNKPAGALMRDAEKLYRTEGMRIANLANRVRLEQAGEQFPGMGKMWLHGGGGKTPRPHHKRMNGVMVPWNAKFTIVTPGGETYKCDGPHDPTLPPGETISCTCTQVPTLPEWEVYDIVNDGKKARDSIRVRLLKEWEFGE